MIRYAVVAVLAMSLQGCALLSLWKSPEPVTVKKEEVARTPLNLPDPPPPKIAPPSWIVITPQNANQVWQRLRDQKTDLVIFGLTDDGYEALSVDFADIRNFIEQQRQLIKEYKKYYEPPKKEEPKAGK